MRHAWAYFRLDPRADRRVWGTDLVWRSYAYMHDVAPNEFAFADELVRAFFEGDLSRGLLVSMRVTR